MVRLRRCIRPVSVLVASFVVTLVLAGVPVVRAATAAGGQTPLADVVSVVEDTAVGGGLGQVSYRGEWVACGGCVPPTPNNSFRYSNAAGATTTIRFVGTRIDLYGVFESHGGIATIQVDDRPVVEVDTYAPTSRVGLWHSSALLESGSHVAVVTNAGRRNPASDAYVVAFDRAQVVAESAARIRLPWPESLTTAPPTPTPLPSGPESNPSGMQWQSGVNGDPLIDPASVEAFCDWRGRACDLAHVYPARNSWDALTQPSFAELNFMGWAGRLVISVPPFPENIGASYAACATGAYDAHWRNFGNTLNSTGRQDSVVRIAWEANGNWFQWSATNPAQYISCWRRIADAINATASPDPLLEWAINAHYSQNPPSHNPLDLYPGDQWVDVVGIDAYDHYPASPTQSAFDVQATAQGGITWLYDFARGHGKQFAVGEWGVATGSGTDGGGDNANYIQYMYDWFAARAGQGLLYEAYFNNCEAANVGSNLYRPPGPGCLYRNTAAGARYQQLW